VATQLKATFKWIRFGLMVGIGGGVPSQKNEIRLGDVVISQPGQGHGGVIQYDFGKATPTGFQATGFLNAPPQILLAAVSKMRARHLGGRKQLNHYVSKACEKENLADFTRESAGPDDLFEASYNHIEGSTCKQCSADHLLKLDPRVKDEIVVHYGTIASSNQVMRDGIQRDQVSKDFGGVLCFETEAAGLMMTFPCLIIRGICDYADSHKNKKWQPRAALVAAACAKELLSMIPPADVVKTSTVEAKIVEGNGSMPGRAAGECM
jgi:nucleoside phosphorylase